jgi:hypothetical protein
MFAPLKLWSWMLFHASFSCLSFDAVTVKAQLFIEISDSVGILPGKDSIFMNPVYFTTTEKDIFYYSCLLETPVCNDTLCQVVHLKVNWDLAGNYLKFDTLEGYPLTKNDHKPFTSEDYKKLHSTLKDGKSILGRKADDELLDESAERYSVKIDGFTGATSIQIKNAVVDGAMYTTYTLWHLVNGTIRTTLLNYTIDHFNPDIENQMLKSGNPKTIILALKQWDDHDYLNRFSEIITIMNEGHPLVNFYIAKNLPDYILTMDKNKKYFKMIWDNLDPNTRSVLYDYLSPD